MPRGSGYHYARPAAGCQNGGNNSSPRRRERAKRRFWIDNLSGVDRIKPGRQLITLFPMQQEGVKMVRFSEELVGVTGEWECMECGYVEEGTEGRRPKKCPECDAPASALEFFSDEDDAGHGQVFGDEYDEEEDEEHGRDEYEEEENGSAFHSKQS
jgi:hypothetical protein